MQQNGTLRKRRRRILAKVAGLSIVKYNEAEDNFEESTGFTPASTPTNKENSSLHVTRTVKGDTKIGISNLLQLSRSASSQKPKLRITRDPSFHVNEPYIKKQNKPFLCPLPTSKCRPISCKADIIKSRPYFLDKNTMSRLRQIIILGVFSGTFPWSWNGKTHRVDKWSLKWGKWWSLQWMIVTVQTSLLTIFQFFIMFKSILMGQHATYRELFMGSFSVYWYVCAVCFNYNMYYYKEQIREYINTLFRFNREFMEKYVVDLENYEDGGRIVINLSIISNTCQVFVSVALFLVMPFQPWYLYSDIYPKPWYWLIPGALQEFIVVGQGITNYILYQWVFVAHTNSVEFWLRESHRNNDSGFTVDELRSTKAALEMYRALQILCACFNDCMSPMAIPMMKMHQLAALIPCGFVFIRSMNHVFFDEFPGILTYPIGIIDCASAGFCLMSLAATVFDLSSGFVASWGKTKHKSVRRMLMSCPTLKVKVGRFYFITISTTITFFKAVVDYIILCIVSFP